MAGGLAAVDVQGLAGDEGRPSEVERIPSTTSSISPARPSGCTAPIASYSEGSCIGVLITPRETALTRTPRSAYSIASERATAARPPFVRDASADGEPLLAWSTRLVVMLTTWPPPWTTIWRIARCVTWKKPARFTAVIASKSSGV